jgi:hypothetical protein
MLAAFERRELDSVASAFMLAIVNSMDLMTKWTEE